MAKIFLKFVITALAMEFSVAQTNPPPTPVDVYVPDGCFCVPNNTCNLVDGGPADGSGQIDARIMASGAAPSPITGANNETNIPISSGIEPVLSTPDLCDTNLELCCPTQGFSCGMVFPPVANAQPPIDGQGQAPFGAFPWQAALLTNANKYIGSGVLIDHLHVLTAAHKLLNVTTPFKVRLGEWDASNDNEPIPAVEVQTATIFIHPKYNAKNLQYDIALIRLASNAPLGEYPTITNICLPSQPISNMRCWVSGWGRNDFSANGKYQSILKAVDVPLVDYGTCLKQLRTTRLGQNFLLDPVSFRCAGGEVAKDACTGDGGAPLSCSVGGRWYLAGLVSWGIGCGQTTVPGVYVNIFNMTGWIQQTTQIVSSPLKTTTTAKGNSMTSSMTTSRAGNSTQKGNSTITTKASNSTSATTVSSKSSNSTTPAVTSTTISNLNKTTTTPAKNGTTTTALKTTSKNATVGASGAGNDTTKTPGMSTLATKASNNSTVFTQASVNSTTTTGKNLGNTATSAKTSGNSTMTTTASGNSTVTTKASGNCTTTTKASGNTTVTTKALGNSTASTVKASGNSTMTTIASSNSSASTVKASGNSTMTTKASNNSTASTVKASGNTTMTTKASSNSTTVKASGNTTLSTTKKVQDSGSGGASTKIAAKIAATTEAGFYFDELDTTVKAKSKSKSK